VGGVEHPAERSIENISLHCSVESVETLFVEFSLSNALPDPVGHTKCPGEMTQPGALLVKSFSIDKSKSGISMPETFLLCVCIFFLLLLRSAASRLLQRMRKSSACEIDKR
jgi:hypothetical protein